MRPYFILLRPHQWPKNLLVLAPLVFSWHLTGPSLKHAGLAFVGFCAVSSAIYVINDVSDATKDRQHPVKKFRPIAANQVSLPVALALFAGLISIGFATTIALPPLFLTCLTAYTLLNLTYSAKLKQLPIIDVMCIAVGFVLRVIGGGEAIAVPISHWIILCTFFVALFLALGKRKNEIATLKANSHIHRSVLQDYTPDFLNQLLGITAAMSTMSYSLYTIDHDTISHFHTTRLIYTIPFVVYGLFRYFHIIYNRSEGGEPTRIVFSDRPIIITITAWLVTFVYFIFVGLGQP